MTAAPRVPPLLPKFSIGRRNPANTCWRVSRSSGPSHPSPAWSDEGATLRWWVPPLTGQVQQSKPFLPWGGAQLDSEFLNSSPILKFYKSLSVISISKASTNQRGKRLKNTVGCFFIRNDMGTAMPGVKGNSEKPNIVLRFRTLTVHV